MLVKDVMKALMEFPLNSPCFVLTKEEDLDDVIGDKFPQLKFGTVTIETQDEAGNIGEDQAVLIIGNFEKYNNEKKEATAE